MTNKKEKLNNNQKRSNHWLFVAVFFLVVTVVSYIFQINQVATMGYEIKDKEKQISELLEEEKQLEIEIANLKSIYKLREEQRKLGMKKPAESTYIEIELDQEVAIK